MNSKEKCYAVLSGQRPDRVPVFPLLMSFAASRAGLTYRQFATNGSALAQAQLKVRECFAIDAISACSDAFRISADLGGEIVYPEDQPPYLAYPLVKNQTDLEHLSKPDVSRSGSRIADRAAAVSEMVRAVGDECLVLGWVDMPFAEACSLCGVSEFMCMIYDAPVLASRILEFLTRIVIDFALLQMEMGAPMIGAGDAAASLVSPEMYRKFALPYEQEVCSAIHSSGGLVKLHICGNTSNLLPDMVQSGADLFNVDHLVEFQKACEIFSSAGKSFKGNLDPVAEILQVTAEECQRLAMRCLRLAAGKRYILSAGCEIPADVKDEVFQAFCEAGGEYAQGRT